jgi:hypothetical protein
MKMTREEVIRIARLVVEEEGWPWIEPVVATRERRFLLFGKVSWHIRTNAKHRGANVNVQVDDKTGLVLSKCFAPR